MNMEESELINFLNELEISGHLRRGKKVGVFVGKLLTYREMFLMVDAEMKQGNEKTVAVQHVSEKFGCSIDTIWRALRIVK